MRLPSQAAARCAAALDGEAFGRAVLTFAVVCASSLGTLPLASFAADIEPPAVTAGSPVAREVVGLLDKYFLDRSFNGVDLKANEKRLIASEPLTDQQALDESERLVSSLGDRYSRVLTPEKATKLGKYDVTGVGLNLVISDSGAVKVGAVPPAESDAARLGVEFGDVVLSINGKPAECMHHGSINMHMHTLYMSAVLSINGKPTECMPHPDPQPYLRPNPHPHPHPNPHPHPHPNPGKPTEGMTSFDALEAIQGEGDTVEMDLRAPGKDVRRLG